MTKLDDLKAVKDRSDLAKFLGFTPKGLAYVLYQLPPARKYRSFEIPKKHGGFRRIDAPEQPLRLLQSRLADRLSKCLEEIEAANEVRANLSHGFQLGRSILTNARAHRKRRYVLNIDLADFFGAINFGRVRGYFIADKHFELEESVATTIAQISCHNNGLPQGSPCSPIISNLIGHILDVRLARLAMEYGCFYTRYADDITFSTNLRTFPRQLARSNKADPKKWSLSKTLCDEIKNSGFTINRKKTRMQIAGSRQEVTGLIVNEKVNIPQEYYRCARSMCHSLFKKGSYYLPHSSINIDGSRVETESLASLEGRLSHVYYVKSRRDRDEKTTKLAEYSAPDAVKKLYHRFLCYKYFFASDAAALITEGKTDVTYINAAIRTLGDDFSDLFNAKNRTTSVRFLRSSYANKAILNLGEGFGGMSSLIKSYPKQLAKFGVKPVHPVILVVDNDDGGGVLKVANSVSSQTIEPKSTASFFFLCENLYLLKTPPNADGVMSCIEDCFPKEVLDKKLNGKPFDRNKKHGDEAAYGKSIFAEQIVSLIGDKKVFAGFVPILRGITDIIVEHKKRAAATSAALEKKAS